MKQKSYYYKRIDRLMHELSVATEIIKIVQNEIAERNIERISTVKLKIGAMAGIDPEALKFSFKAASAKTSLAGAILDIDWLVVKGKCKSCGKNFEIDDLVFMCPHCDSADITITQGEELNIAYIIEG